MRNAFAAALALVLTTSSLGRAQPPAPRPQDVFEGALSVLETEVWVRVERGGEPVAGLDADDFEVRSGGRVLPIVAFEAFDLGADRAASPAELSRVEAAPGADEAATARRFLAVFDIGRTSHAYLKEAALGLRALLEDGLHPTDELAIALWGTKGVELLHGFSRDRALAAAGLDVVEATLERSPRRQREARQALRASLRSGDRTALVAQLGLGGALLAADGASPLAMLAGPATGSLGTERYAELEALREGAIDEGEGDRFWSAAYDQASTEVAAEDVANRALGELARSLSGVPGPRYALLFAQGYAEFSRVIVEFGSLADVPPPAAALLRTYRELTQSLVDAGWVMHSFDVTGVGGRAVGNQPGHDVTSTASAGFVPFRQGGLAGGGDDSLLYVARRTGGDLYDNFNRLDRAVGRMLERTRVAYRLVFQISGEELQRGPVDWEVRLRGDAAGATVRGAEEYRASRRAADERRDPRRLQQRLLGSEEVHGLGADIVIATMPAGAGLQRAGLALHVPASAAAGASLWVQAVSLDPASGAVVGDGAIHDTWAQVVDGLTESPGLAGRVLAGDLLAPCSGARLRIRLLAGDGEAEELATRHLPSCDEAPAFTVLPLRRLEDGERIFAEVGFEPSDSSTSPFAVSGRAFVPAAEPVTPRRDTLSLLVHVGAWHERSRVEALLVDDADQPVRAGPLQPQQLERSSDGPSARFLASVGLADLAPGSYRLLLRWMDGEDVVDEQGVAFEIR